MIVDQNYAQLITITCFPVFLGLCYFYPLFSSIALKKQYGTAGHVNYDRAIGML